MFRFVAFLALFLLLAAHPADAPAQDGAAPEVVVTIKPLHSLAAALMEGVAAPSLLLDGAVNPHDYRLRPSEARLLQEADVLFWVGPALEGKAIGDVARNARIVSLADEHEHDEHEHDEHEHDEHGHDEHEHDEHEGHDHDEHEHDEHAHEHGEDANDPHIWLNPRRAAEMIAPMEAALAAADPANAAVYRANAVTLQERLEQLDAQLETRMTPLRSRGGYIVFHDAFGRFETRYGLNAAGALLDASAHGHEHGASARRMTQLRELIRAEAENIACVFVEPAFDPAQAEALVEGSDTPVVLLDPLGASVSPGADAYFTLMEDIAASFEACLGD